MNLMRNKLLSPFLGGDALDSGGTNMFFFGGNLFFKEKSYLSLHGI